MQFKKDKSGKLDKVVQYIIKKYRPDLECLTFLCVWRDKEKLNDGRLVEAEVYKLSNKNRDVFGYDVMLEVDLNLWKTLSKEEKKKLIFHEAEHIKVEYDLVDSEDSQNKSNEESAKGNHKKRKKSKEITESDVEVVESSRQDAEGNPRPGISAQEIFEKYLVDDIPYGEPKRDKQDRVVFSIVPHTLEILRHRRELLNFGLSEEEEAIRLFLNHVKKNVGMTQV